MPLFTLYTVIFSVLNFGPNSLGRYQEFLCFVQEIYNRGWYICIRKSLDEISVYNKGILSKCKARGKWWNNFENILGKKKINTIW